MIKTISLAILTALFIVLVPGCAEPEPESSAPGPAPAATPAPATEPEPAAEAKVDSVDKLREQMVNYVAPFPSRSTLFVPAKQVPGASSEPSSEGSVQLRGLVDVGEPKAILDIEGAIALVAAGSEKYGVRVVSIDKRSVVLQRGSSSWTATLE